MRILVVGGAGVFGGKLVERLVAMGGCEILVGGRNLSRGEAVAGRYPGGGVSAAVVNRERVGSEEIRALAVGIVVDAAGPFQGQAPRLARVAIEAGAHFVDLADARDYVAGFAALNEMAREAGVLAVTGASSTPALSNAVLDNLTDGWLTVDAVSIAISPGNRAPRGVAVTQAILSYVGKPVKVWDGGAWRERAGWSMLHRRELKGLGRRWLSICETPDLDLVPQRFAGVQSVRFFAGLELGALHVGLWLCGLLVRWGLVKSLVPAAGWFVKGANVCGGLGTDRGGMMVEAEGLEANGKRVRAVWSLVAEAGDGPHIPVLPAVALIRKLVAGTETRRGAMACVGLLNLRAIEAEFKGFRIFTSQAIAAL